MASISMEELKKMKVNDLKKELKDRGLAVSGTKDVLLERLQEAVEGKEEAQVTGDTTTTIIAEETASVEKSIDEIVSDTTVAEPVSSTPTTEVVSKENIPETTASEEKEKKEVSPKDLSDEERLKARAAKFGGTVSESAKKLLRAERFGITSTDSTASTGNAGDVDKLKKRAERFGMVVSNELSKVDEAERKRKRLERFGAAALSSTEVKKVKLNSTDAELEEKKKKRAARFGLT